MYLTRLFEKLQGFDHTDQLHAVVGGVRFASRYFLFSAVVSEDGAPASGSRIARAGSVGKNLYLFQEKHSLLMSYLYYIISSRICNSLREIGIIGGIFPAPAEIIVIFFLLIHIVLENHRVFVSV